MSQDVEEKARQLSDWLAEQMPIGANCHFAHGDGRHYDFSMHVPGRMRDAMLLVTLEMLEDQEVEDIMADLKTAKVPQRLRDNPAQRLLYKGGAVTEL